MKAPIIWLKDFTDIDVEPKALADTMTMTGSKVEDYFCRRHSERCLHR